MSAAGLRGLQSGTSRNQRLSESRQPSSLADHRIDGRYAAIVVRSVFSESERKQALFHLFADLYGESAKTDSPKTTIFSLDF